MPSFITFKSVSYSTPDGRSLFEGLDLAFGTERTGLVGRNGVGKTTLLKLVLGECQPRAGKVRHNGRIAILRQSLGASDETLADLFGASGGLAQLERITSGHAEPGDLDTADWTLEARMNDALALVALDGTAPERPLASLSGGETTRAALAALIFQAPDLILLDEPTNNLDAAGRAIVTRVLAEWKSGAIVVSHDRALLRETDRIVELSQLGVKIYGGNWDAYAAARAAERGAALRELKAAEHTTKVIERRLQLTAERKQKRDAQAKKSRFRRALPKLAADRWQGDAEISGAKARETAARLRQEARDSLEEARAKVEILNSLKATLPATGLSAGRRVLALDQVSYSLPDGRKIIGDLSFEIVGPERIALVGPNGAGKTTLLKLALGELTPAAGHITRFDGGIAMLDQRVALLDSTETILANFRRQNTGSNDNQCRAALARFLFRADAAFQRVGDLSGGERLRAGLACVLGRENPPQLLMLDEPTNHLDLDSIEAIEQALAGYDGALLVASHDEDFLTAIGATRRLEVRQRGNTQSPPPQGEG